MASSSTTSSYLWLEILGIILLSYLFTAYMTRSFPIMTGKRICLLIAHPDDEAMFFSPTLRSLTRPELGNQVVILCLSSGNAEGLGGVRKEELGKSAVILGLRSSERVVVVEDEGRFKDSMGRDGEWDAKEISSTLMRFFAPHYASIAVGEQPTAHIDALITFDPSGISGHPNHKSLYHGALAFLRQLTAGRQGWECPVKMYTLTSVSLLRKYASILDCLPTILVAMITRKEKGDFPAPLLAVGTPGDFLAGQRAMTRAHKSQMRWFRWGWIGVGRYMVVNDLRKVKGF